MVSDFTKEKCEKVVAEIENGGGEAISVRCDVRKKSEVEAMVNSAVNKWGKIDILVNNAGISEAGPLLEDN
ncbi:MAG TPA: SDR family NAD(P)-dependent oxidoreductase [Dehalococcoidia bacterium]|nr:SDR family NAD(P)-dependent oxidoreductase [Dehalococcoidia bacterium]